MKMILADQEPQREERYTPGPWRVEGANGNLVYSPDGWIADIRGGTTGSHSPVASANARLVAAAPDLLAALQELRYARTDKAKRMADAAITKALSHDAERPS